MSWKNEQKRAKNLLYKRWTGRVLTRSSALRPEPFDLDPDGSGSIQRSWSVMEIRIHQPRGFGPVRLGFCGFFSVFLTFLLCAPLCLLFGPPVRFNFFIKIPKNYYVFLICFWLFGDIFTCSGLMKIIRVNFTFDSYILYVSREFSCAIFDPKLVMWCWCLALNLMTSLPLILSQFIQLC